MGAPQTRVMTVATTRAIPEAPAGTAPSPGTKAVNGFGDVVSASPGRPETETPETKRVLGTLGDAEPIPELLTPASPDTPDASPVAREPENVPEGDVPVENTSPESSLPGTTFHDADALFFRKGRPRRSKDNKAVSETKKTAKFARNGDRLITRQHWVPDRDAKRCAEPTCDTPFSVVTRRHHCRSCGNVFCKRCVDARLLLNPKTAKPVISFKNKSAIAARVCLNCYSNAFDTAKAMEGCLGIGIFDDRQGAITERSLEDDGKASQQSTVSFASNTTCSESLPGVYSECTSSASDTSSTGSANSGQSRRSLTLRRNPPTAFLSARQKIEAAERIDLKGEHGTKTDVDTGKRDADTHSESLVGTVDTKTSTVDAESTVSNSPGPRTESTEVSEETFSFATPVSISTKQTTSRDSTQESGSTSESPLETAEARKVRRDTAALLAQTPEILLKGSPCETQGHSDPELLKGLVSRYNLQLKEQARLTEDAATQLREQQRKNAATEEELLLARAQVRRMGALWEELTNARRELEAVREIDVGTTNSKKSETNLALFETRWVGGETNCPTNKWSSSVVWHCVEGGLSVTPSTPSKVFRGVTFQDTLTGVTRRVPHRDVDCVKTVFEENSGRSAFVVSILEGSKSFVEFGREVRCRVDGAVTANRWAIEIQKLVGE